MKLRILQVLALALIIAGSSCNNGTGNKSDKDSALTTKHKYMRYNANSPGGQKALAAMQKALDSMRKMDCSNVLSLYYQGAMHWIPDTINNNTLCPSYANKSQLKKAWDNCTHVPGIEINFLAWHRLYIWHFEEIVRKLSGDADFALPYWGYTDTTNLFANRVMNEMMRKEGSSLFEKSRFQPLNEGKPISGAIVKALDLKPLMRLKDVYLFTKTIDNAPHGAMHNYIGGGNANTYDIFNPIYNCNCNNTGPANDTCNGGLMANVPSAGFDPIFYLHHSNIDRIWQQWTNSPNGKLVTVDDLKAYPWGYTFFNPDGSEKDYTAEEVIAAIYNVDYEYDDTPTPAEAKDDATKAKKQPSLFLSAKKFADTVVSQKINKVMTDNTISFSVKNDAPKLQTLLKKDNSPKNTIIVMKVSFTREPKGIYQVYINQPKGQALNPDGDYFAGFMTFFGAKHHAQHIQGNTLSATGRAEKVFLFEMTDQFNTTNAAQKGTYEVSIVNEEGKGAAAITVESVSVIVK
ncbi:MAG: tyrosinase family protein [Filimonas sp.]|nr:tyrosinase family protein [Filimonas sp.]